MCGIAGVVGARAGSSVLTLLLEALRHRGPDGDGRLLTKDVALGMRRLSILDIENGDQPRREQGLAVFCNGEIYNHAELRRDRDPSGRCDIDVIGRLWADEGPAGLNRLNGMFAAVIWDEQKRQLHLVRDRLGIKPLWLWERNGEIAYSSELRAFAAAGFELTPDPTALWDYLTHSYIPAPRSPFREVSLVPPGHRVEISERDGCWTSRLERWWQLPSIVEHMPSVNEAVEHIRLKLEESVRRRLLSERPLGCLLSGGLDSAVLTALATKVRGGPIETFSVGYDDRTHDERPAAATLAEDLGCPHHSVGLDPAQFLDTLDRAVVRGDTLLADQAVVALAPLYDRVAAEVTVVLDGDGADELFAGYPTVDADRWFRSFSGLPTGLRRGLSSLSRALPESSRKGSWLMKFERFLRHVDMGRREAHALWRNIHSLEARQDLVCPGAHPADQSDLLGVRSWLGAMSEGDSFEDFARADLGIWLPDDNLKKVDGQSMGVSVEARVPFLDHELVELVASWPVTFKRCRGVKGLLREAAKGILPGFALERPKAGFHLPLAGWLHGPLRDQVAQRLQSLGELAGDWLDAGALARRVASGRLDAYSVLNLLVLESWWRQWPTKLTISI